MKRAGVAGGPCETAMDAGNQAAAFSGAGVFLIFFIAII